MKSNLLILLMIAFIPASAQPGQYNWYLGGIYGINFANGRQVLPPHPDNTLQDFSGGIPASISDPVTGQFLFQANGTRILDRNFNRMPGAGSGVLAFQTMIVPILEDVNKYAVVYSRNDSIMLAFVDMTLRGGLGDVVSRDRLVQNKVLGRFSVARSTGREVQIIITHPLNGDEWQCFHLRWNIDPGGAHVSWSGGKIPAKPVFNGAMITSKLGTRVAFAALFDDASPKARIELLRINKCTRKVELIKNLRIKVSGTSNATGTELAFSPTDKYLFASVMSKDVLGKCYQEIWRYNLHDPDPDLTCLSLVKLEVVPWKSGSIAPGPDGKIYVNSWDITDGKPVFSIIHDPEGPGVSFEYGAFIIPGMNPPPQTQAIPFPMFNADTMSFVGRKFDFDFTYGCWGDSAFFSYDDDVLAFYDSIYWDFGDGKRSYDLKGSHMYANKGDYLVVLKYWWCGIGDNGCGIGQSGIEKKIRIQEKPVSNLNGRDTLLCAGAEINLTAEKGIDVYLWSTGDTAWSIQVDSPGRYWVRSQSGTCVTYDTMTIAYNPPLWVELGGEHYLCEDDSQTVTLDAGKGFTHYLWNPTQDTTQWILVRRSGDYYVIVEDFHGCSGEDGTLVERRCDHFIEIPNAFTPNGDGLNDVFAPFSEDLVSYSVSLYNRWGERIYSSEEQLTGWDGTFKGVASPGGVYFYHIVYTGYLNHVLRKRTVSGVVNLLR